MAFSYSSTPATREDRGHRALAALCQKGFSLLVRLAEKSSSVTPSCLQEIREQQDRYKQWADHFGALLPDSPGPPDGHWLGTHPAYPEKYLGHYLAMLVGSLLLATEVARGRLPGKRRRTWGQIIDTAAAEFAKFDTLLDSRDRDGIRWCLEMKFKVKIVKMDLGNVHKRSADL